VSIVRTEGAEAAVELVGSPWANRFYDLLTLTEKELVLVSPFIGRQPVRRVRRIVAGGGSTQQIRVRVLTNLTVGSMVSGSLDVAALLEFVETVPNTTITHLPSLHAKVYIVDERFAVVTSANLTGGGLAGNREYGVLIRDPGLVSDVRADFMKYALLGSVVPAATLRELAAAAEELREIGRQADRSSSARLRSLFTRRAELANLEVLRTRARGKTTHRIFLCGLLSCIPWCSRFTLTCVMTRLIG